MTSQGRQIALLLVLGACEHDEVTEAARIQHAPPEETTTHVENREHVEPPPPAPSPRELRRDRLRGWYAGLSSDLRTNVATVCRYRVDNPCSGRLKIRYDANEPELDPSIASTGNQYCEELYHPARCDTPLVIAFDSEPVAFAAHWPTASTPWLAIDRDGDGELVERADLFAGFATLAPLDDNGDGLIDARDAAFSSLLLWGDRDGDHRSSPDELRPASAVVVRIPLQNELRPRCTAQDDCEGERGRVEWRGVDGAVRTGAVIDVYMPVEDR